MRKLILFCVPIFGLFACSSEKEKGNIQRPVRTNTVIADAFVVRSIPLSENIVVAGSLMPAEATDIRPEISGRLVSIHFKEGSFVRKGSLLAKLFDGDLQAQLKKLEVQLAINEKTVERYKELLKIQGVSQQDVDLSELQVSNNKADIELVKVDIAKTEIRAPFDGRLGLRNISLGAYVSPADVIATIREVDQLKLEFTVPEKYSADFFPGKTISFTVDGVASKFTATVLATEYFIDANTRSLNIKALVNGRHKLLVPGAFAKVGLDLDKDSNAIIIPTQSVIPLSHGKQVIVYRNGDPRFLSVTTGIRDSVYVQVLNGVNIGDTVLVSGLMSVKPDSKLQLSKIQ